MSIINSGETCSDQSENELQEVAFNGNQCWTLDDGFLTDISFKSKSRFGHPCDPMPFPNEYLSYDDYFKSVVEWAKYMNQISRTLVLPVNSSAFIRRPINITDSTQLKRFPKNYLINPSNQNYLLNLFLSESEIQKSITLPSVPPYAKDQSINSLLFVETTWISKNHSQIPIPELFDSAEDFKTACKRWAKHNKAQLNEQISFKTIITSNPHFDPKRIDLSAIGVQQNHREHNYYIPPLSEPKRVPISKQQFEPSSKMKENLIKLLKNSKPEFQPLYVIQDYPNMPQLDINIVPNKGTSIGMNQMPFEFIYQLEKYGTNSQNPRIPNHLQFLGVSAFAGKPLSMHGINSYNDFIFCLNQVPCSRSALFHLEVFLALQQYAIQNYHQIRILFSSNLVLFYNAITLICEFSEMPVATVDPLFNLISELSKSTEKFKIMLIFTHRIAFTWQFSTVFAAHFERPEIFGKDISETAAYLKKIASEQLSSYLSTNAHDITQLLDDQLNDRTAPLFCVIIALFMKTRSQSLQLFFSACGTRLFTALSLIAKTVPKQFIEQILPSVRSPNVLPKMLRLFLSCAIDPRLLAPEFSNEYTLLLRELFGQPSSAIEGMSFEFSDALISGLMQYQDENKLWLLSYLCSFLRRCAKEGLGEPDNYIPIAANLVFTIVMTVDAPPAPVLIALDSLLRTDSAGIFLGGVASQLKYLGRLMVDPAVDVECWGCVKTIAVRFPEHFHVALQAKDFQECFIAALKSITPLTALQLFIMVNKAVKGSKGQRRLLTLRRDKSVPSLAEDLSLMLKRAHVNLARTVRWTETFLDEEDYYNNRKILKAINRALKSDSSVAKLFNSK